MKTCARIVLFGFFFASFFSCKTAEKKATPVTDPGSSVYNLCVSKGYIATSESKLVAEIQRAEVDLRDGESRNFLLARLKDVRPDTLPKEVVLESLFSGARSSVLGNEKLICYPVPRMSGVFKGISQKKPLFLETEGIDFSKGQSFFYVGSRSKNQSKRDFIPALNEYIKGGLEQFPKFGLKGWIVYADEEYFFSIMNWNERTSADLANMDERGQALQKTIETVVVPFMNIPLKGIDQQAESGEFIQLEL